MSSIRNTPSTVVPDDAVLDAARATVLAVGWRRASLTEVARRAGVSRMTLYRRWGDARGLLADLMVREWGSRVRGALDPALAGGAGTGARGLAEAVVACLRAVREDALFAKILEVDAELLLPYLVERRGRTQDLVLDLLVDALSAARAAGTVRDTDPDLLARGVVLALHGFLVSARTMTSGTPGTSGTSEQVTVSDLDDELVVLLERYLAP